MRGFLHFGPPLGRNAIPLGREVHPAQPKGDARSPAGSQALAKAGAFSFSAMPAGVPVAGSIAGTARSFSTGAIAAPFAVPRFRRSNTMLLIFKLMEKGPYRFSLCHVHTEDREAKHHGTSAQGCRPDGSFLPIDHAARRQPERMESPARWQHRASAGSKDTPFR
jgi:hypothetical protein